MYMHHRAIDNLKNYDIETIEEMELEAELPIVEFAKIPKKKKKFDDGTKLKEKFDKKRITHK